MVTIEVDTVDPYDVPPALTNNMSFSQNLKLVNKTDNPEDIEILLQEISTPTEEPYIEVQAERDS